MANEKVQGPRKVWKFLFVLSLALNVAVIGLVVGVGYRFANGKPPQAFEFGLGPIGMALSPQQRREIGRSLRENANVRGMSRPRNDRMTAQVIDALRSEPFDKEVLQQALSSSRERAQLLQAAARDAFIAQVEAMSGDERAAFAERIENATKRRKQN